MKYFDEEGNEHELPTPEEIKTLQDAGSGSEELEKLTKDVREALELDEDADIMEAIKNAKEAGNPNWPAARKKIENLTAFIKNSNKDAEINDDGEVITKKNMDPDALLAESEARTKKILLQEKIDAKLAAFPEDKREVMKTYFERLSAGEELTTESVDKFMGEAQIIVFPQQEGSPQINGAEPNLGQPGAKKDHADTPEGQEAANTLFGDESFANAENQNGEGNNQPKE